MNAKSTFQPQELEYLRLLAKQYPTVQAASTEIINLQAILGLPKGTEHFISDIHGEYEAFLHILNSCSGVVKEKLDELFGTTMTRAEQEFRICKNASYSPWISEIKCSVPLGRPRMAWRLMISVLAACTVGYCLASSCRYCSSWG